MEKYDSSNKPDPVPCNTCGKDKPLTKINNPFTGKQHWVHCACPCEIEQLEQDKEDQKRRERRIRINRILRLSSSMDDIKNMSFENFKPREGAEDAYREVKDAVQNFDKREKLGVFIFGETGNGKSHLTAAGGNELIKRGYSVIFLTEKDLFSRLEATKNFRNEETFQEIMSACLDADLLIWDDFLSSQRLKDEEKDWLFQIINGRERANKPIWATSNITPQEFKSDEIAFRLDDRGRTWWRMIGNMNPVFNKAQNYRKAKAYSRAMGITVDEYEMGEQA